MTLKFGQYEIDVDIEKTKAFYEKAKLVSKECSCDGCQNFEKAVDVLPEAVRVFFIKLGIDMKKPAECYVYNTNEDGSLSYGGFYHVCGTILSGNSSWVKSGQGAYWKDDLSFHITPDFHITIHDDISLLEKDFPLPVIELDIVADIPWMLEKENSY